MSWWCCVLLCLDHNLILIVICGWLTLIKQRCFIGTRQSHYCLVPVKQPLECKLKQIQKNGDITHYAYEVLQLQETNCWAVVEKILPTKFLSTGSIVFTNGLIWCFNYIFGTSKNELVKKKDIWCQELYVEAHKTTCHSNEKYYLIISSFPVNFGTCTKQPSPNRKLFWIPTAINLLDTFINAWMYNLPTSQVHGALLTHIAMLMSPTWNLRCQH